jgi:nicotinamidase-related amidase
MTAPDRLPTSAARLLLVDYQVGVLGGLGPAGKGLTARVAELVSSARQIGIGILHVRTAFRPGHPEVSPGNRLFAGLAAAGRLVEGGADTAFHPDLLPAPEDVVVTKHRIDPFWGTELDMVLRAGGVDALVVAGIVTSGAVLSTVRSAANRDLRVLVVGDCCADRDEEVHATLLQRVLAMTAEVVSSGTWHEALLR